MGQATNQITTQKTATQKPAKSEFGVQQNSKTHGNDTRKQTALGYAE